MACGRGNGCGVQWSGACNGAERAVGWMGCRAVRAYELVVAVLHRDLAASLRLAYLASWAEDSRRRAGGGSSRPGGGDCRGEA